MCDLYTVAVGSGYSLSKRRVLPIYSRVLNSLVKSQRITCSKREGGTEAEQRRNRFLLSEG